ncbi:MAG: T9SS type A sorting domain-containing protein [FCB group bacterium]|nr:T9SS type A sorting domain-containing protein [FCB group bacterium]MBL7027266.1 T9SS type A sorting domain-containing protein [Candidatus Neomarinimicrobiota bacterium]MBL7122236.1 T9SS type A sorting domain-containing protein [Candidatus Neomarinimicrobiota bacterium]
MIHSKIRYILLMISLMTPSLFGFIQTEPFGVGEITSAPGEYQPNPNRNNITRDIDVVMSNLDGFNADVDFGGWTGDYFMQLYVPTADGFINSIDFHFSDLAEYSGGGIQVQIYESNYDWPEINTSEIADDPDYSSLGYYDEESGVEIMGSNWIFGGINNNDGAIVDKVYDPLGAQVWPSDGFGELSLEPNDDDGDWFNFDLLASGGSSYEFTRNEPFVLVAKFVGFPEYRPPDGWCGTGDGTYDDMDYRMGFYAARRYVDPQPTMKFNGQYWYGGWYIRSYIWDWDVHVTLTGDRGPVISNWTQLDVTLDHGPRTVTADIFDDNPAGGTFGVASAELMYSIDGGEYVAVAMTENDTAWIADIPGQASGHVDYYFSATDINDLTTTTPPFGYDIFVPGAPALVVFNGGAISGYPYEYYFGISGSLAHLVADFPHDVWATEIQADLATAYTTIYEFSDPFDGPDDDNREVIRAWLAEGHKNYFLSGDELFGVWTGWEDQDYVVGDFEYDVLGINHIYNDIAESSDATTDIEAVAGNILTGGLYTAHNALGDTLVYDPVYEIGGLNGLDGFDPINPAEVKMTLLDGSTAIGLNREVSGDKIVFLGFDPMSINARPYTWWGYDSLSVQTQSLLWFGILDELVDVDDDAGIPGEFSLAQNYPNPFNPSTTIEYDLPKQADVFLAIYDITGREIQTLVSTSQSPGNYQVSWDGTNRDGQQVAAGMYFARLWVGDSFSVVKMVYLR